MPRNTSSEHTAEFSSKKMNITQRSLRSQQSAQPIHRVLREKESVWSPGHPAIHLSTISLGDIDDCTSSSTHISN